MYHAKAGQEIILIRSIPNAMTKYYGLGNLQTTAPLSHVLGLLVDLTCKGLTPNSKMRHFCSLFSNH